MASFWNVTKEKFVELGILGSILGVIWVIGILLLYDAMREAYLEHVPSAGGIYGGMLVVWIIVGLAIYLWQDPHGTRETLQRRFSST